MTKNNELTDVVTNLFLDTFEPTGTVTSDGYIEMEIKKPVRMWTPPFGISEQELTEGIFYIPVKQYEKARKTDDKDYLDSVYLLVYNGTDTMDKVVMNDGTEITLYTLAQSIALNHLQDLSKTFEALDIEG
jgi:hypothetical protein